MNEVAIQRDLDPSERLIFQTQMASRRKSPTTALMLCLFLGGLGAHKFYMGKILTGVLFIVFVWTFIPLIISVFNLFTIRGAVRRYNDRQAMEVVAQIKALR